MKNLLKIFSNENSKPFNTLSRWVQKYKISNYNDFVFDTKKVELNLLFLIILRSLLSFKNQLIGLITKEILTILFI